MNHDDPEDVKVFIQFSGNPILNFCSNFGKCVSGANLRGRFRVKCLRKCIELHFHLVELFEHVSLI